MQRPAYVWDYNIDQDEFDDIMAGRLIKGRLNRDWAAVRVIEYAPYREIIRLIGYGSLVENRPRWHGKVRSKSRVRGLDFLVEWLPKNHPELLHV